MSNIQQQNKNGHNISITGGSFGSVENHGEQNIVFGDGSVQQSNQNGSNIHIGGNVRVTGRVSGGNVNISGVQYIGASKGDSTSFNFKSDVQPESIKTPMYIIVYMYVKTHADADIQSMRFESFGAAYEHATKHIADEYTTASGVALVQIKSIEISASSL